MTSPTPRSRRRLRSKARSQPTAACGVAIRDGERKAGLEHARAALDRSTYDRDDRLFVSAYRGCPELIVCLLEDKSNQHGPLPVILSKVGRRRAQIATCPGAQHSVLALSPREKEVLVLTGAGNVQSRNRNELFISPVTVKVHVRHIFEKLGVKSRAAAALRATQLDRDYATCTMDTGASSETASRSEKSKSRSDQGGMTRPLSQGSPRTLRPPSCRTGNRQPVPVSFAQPGSASPLDTGDLKSSRYRHPPPR